MKDAVVVPCGMVTQWTVDSEGNRVPKYRPTHDQSFDYSEGNSINHRLLKDNLPELFYGFCLLRILHYVHVLRLAKPSKSIIISKIDVKSAYRRGTMSGDLAARSITIVCGFALLIRCLPFGGPHCPNLWCVASKAMTDLGNDLLSCPDWDESAIFSPHVSKLKPPKFLPNNIPFGKALPPDVCVPPVPFGRIDDFIDDLVTVGYASEGWRRLCGAALLSLHALSRPVSNDEPIPRDDVLALNKLLSEGSAAEVQTVLG